MTQSLIDDLLGPIPPSTIDLDRIIAEDHHRRRLRAGASAGCALAVAATVMVSGVLAGGDTLTVTGPTPSAVVVTPAPTGFRPDPTDPDATLERLRVAWEKAMAAVAPDVAFVYMPDVAGETPGPDAPSMRVQVGNGVIMMDGQPPRRLPGPTVFTGRAGITRGGQRAGLYLALRADCGPNEPCTIPPACAKPYEAVQCAMSTTADGRELFETVERWPPDYLFYDAGIRHGAGKYYVGLSAVNYFGGDGSPASAAAPLLTQAELRAITIAIADQITP